ncbi:MAG: metallophosphoesterase family protein [Geobacter sp.]
MAHCRCWQHRSDWGPGQAIRENVMRRFAIGDIHGGLQTFLALIRRINPRDNDRIYLLGDYIDRGPDSKGVLETIISMQEAGCDIRPIRGNHEDMLIRNLSGDHDLYSWAWVENWGQKTLFSFGVKRPEDLPVRYRKFLAGLPYYLEEEDFIFVHAGLNLGLDDPVRDTPAEQMVWERSYIPESRPAFMQRVVCGHRVCTLDAARQSLHEQVIQIDNGAFTNQQPEHGNLLALNLDTMQLFVQPWIDRKAVW